MADATPLKRGATGFEMFASTDTVPAANIAGQVVISPSQITADQDNYAPTGWVDADVVRVSFDTTCKAITGLTAWTNGKPKWIINTGANCGYLPSEHPDSSAANRIAGEGDWILEGYGAIMVAYDSTSSRVRVVQTTFDIWSLFLSGRAQPFFPPPGSTVQADQAFLGLAQASSGSNGNTAPTSSLPGAWDVDNGGNAAGASTIYFSKNNNGFSFFGSAHIVIGFGCWVSALSTSSQRYKAQISLTNNPSGTAINNNNSFGFRYIDNANSGKWLFFSRDNAGAETTADTAITVAANTYYRGLLMIDKARAEQRIFITDGTTTYQARNTGNLPNAVLCGARSIIVKSIGTGTVTFNSTITGYEIRV